MPALFTARPSRRSPARIIDRVFDINVGGTLFTLQAVARHMIERRAAAARSSTWPARPGRRGEALVAVYCATKAAVISLTQSAGLDLIKHGINVNAIAPGVVDGEHWDGVDALLRQIRTQGPGQKKKEVGEAVPSAAWAAPRT
jgi:NAD(P)-dependent dehydrogenase (short-subunit alcohol dehydrogenase family)